MAAANLARLHADFAASVAAQAPTKPCRRSKHEAIAHREAIARAEAAAQQDAAALRGEAAVLQGEAGAEYDLAQGEGAPLPPLPPQLGDDYGDDYDDVDVSGIRPGGKRARRGAAHAAAQVQMDAEAVAAREEAGLELGDLGDEDGPGNALGTRRERRDADALARAEAAQQLGAGRRTRHGTGHAQAAAVQPYAEAAQPNADAVPDLVLAARAETKLLRKRRARERKRLALDAELRAEAAEAATAHAEAAAKAEAAAQAEDAEAQAALEHARAALAHEQALDLDLGADGTARGPEATQAAQDVYQKAVERAAIAHEQAAPRVVPLTDAQAVNATLDIADLHGFENGPGGMMVGTRALVPSIQ